MKIRIKENTVRLRLTKNEVDTLCSSGSYSEKTQFPNQTFTYSINTTESETPNASFTDNEITIELPKNEIMGWETDNRVGFKHQIPLTNNESLSILVEKDFVCLDQRDEDQSDNYPNPKSC